MNTYTLNVFYKKTVYAQNTQALTNTKGYNIHVS